jgi:hypothetical protein
MTNNTETQAHTINKTLTMWGCTCGTYGVLYTVAQRDAMTSCPNR